jgi:cold shock protein
MPTGIVKWFNSAKGYGFICPAEGGHDIFAHFSAIIMDGYKCLKAGQTVQFEVNQGPKGLHASQIRPEKGLEEDETHTECCEEKEMVVEMEC